MVNSDICKRHTCRRFVVFFPFVSVLADDCMFSFELSISGLRANDYRKRLRHDVPAVKYIHVLSDLQTMTRGNKRPTTEEYLGILFNSFI